MSVDGKLFNFTLAAGLAGTLFGYYFATRRQKNMQESLKATNIQPTIIDLDKFAEKSMYKIVPLLNRIKERLDKYPRIIARNFVKVEGTQVLDNKIRVMQWNTLARALFAQDDPSMSHKFTSEMPEETYDWENFRKWRILEEILRYDNDIICLEEVDSYEELKPFLHSLGYTSFFCPKYGSSCLLMNVNTGPDGCAIFYKLNKFQIHNIHFENICVNGMNHQQVFPIVQLRHLATKKLFTLVCLHLKSKERSADQRTEQMTYILQILKRHLNTVTDLSAHPIILCGDFNGEPFEKFYSLIMNDELLKFESAYSKCIDSNTGKLLPSTFKLRESLISRTIDYIFYTNSNLRLLQYLRLPSLGDIAALPNLSYPSDHLSLVCDFEFI